MLKRIYSYLAIVAASMLFLVACDDDDDDKVTHYSSQIDASSSMLRDEMKDVANYEFITVFSVDGGATFVDYPIIAVGQTYQVKVIDRKNEDSEINADTWCAGLDWSASNPQPNSVLPSGVAEFTMNSINDLIVKVVDHVPFTAASWTGTFSAIEDYGSSGTAGPYDLVLTQDTSNPNRFHMDNFYGSNLPAYIDFDGNTGTVKFPDQSTGGLNLTKSSGTFNPCSGEIELHLNYDGGDWTYHLTKE